VDEAHREPPSSPRRCGARRERRASSCWIARLRSSSSAPAGSSSTAAGAPQQRRASSCSICWIWRDSAGCAMASRAAARPEVQFLGHGLEVAQLAQVDHGMPLRVSIDTQYVLDAAALPAARHSRDADRVFRRRRRRGAGRPPPPPSRTRPRAAAPPGPHPLPRRLRGGRAPHLPAPSSPTSRARSNATSRCGQPRSYAQYEFVPACWSTSRAAPPRARCWAAAIRALRRRAHGHQRPLRLPRRPRAGAGRGAPRTCR
jgi:hypothetical protein